jgi:hypothetical protein
MAPTDDWQWFWASEHGRDRILRDEVEGLHAQLSSASAQTSRLSSQLANLSGSIESRLNALSRAFDAYVELGDVREELAAYEEPAAVRRDVVAAVEALAGGRPAPTVDPRGLDYWLPSAMNAVIAMVDGRAAGEELDRARGLASETDLFVVAACGALGRGAAAAGQLPSVLAADQELTAHQLAIWTATAAGLFGDLTDALAADWVPLLDREPVNSWTAWVTGHAPTPSAGITWLRALIEPPSTSLTTTHTGVEPAQQHSIQVQPAATAATATEGLRTVVTELVGWGMPAEAELLRRARELRARIENPNAGTASATEAEPMTVVSAVRWALQDPATAPSVRAALVSWASSALVDVVDELTAAAKAAPPTEVTLRGRAGGLVVTATGPDPAAVATEEARIATSYEVSNRSLIGWSTGAGAAVLLTLVLAVAGSGWAWLTAIGIVVGVIGAIRQVQARAATRRAGAEALQELEHDLAEATGRVDRTEQERTAMLVQLTGEAAGLRERLVSAVGQTVAR